MLTFLKLGGSVITDKQGREAPDLPLIKRLAAEIRAARDQQPGQRLIIGHGSGSFGHPYAARYGIHRGLAPDADWAGFAQTSAAALRLNRIVVDALLAANLPAFALQPSATISTAAGRVVTWQTDPLALALERGLIPVIHGDVAFDTVQGSAIASTEALFAYLTLHSPLVPDRLILVGEDAVYTADPRCNPAAQPIPLITAATITTVLAGAGASHAVDVTGGMRSKLELMWQLIQARPTLTVQLIGPHPGLLTRALLAAAEGVGTTMRMH